MKKIFNLTIGFLLIFGCKEEVVNVVAIDNADKVIVIFDKRFNYEGESKKPDTIVHVEPTPDPEEIRDSLVERSRFKNLGCCEKEPKEAVECCCTELVKNYREIYSTLTPEELNEINLQDPIFSGCYNNPNYASEIDKIENPDFDIEEEDPEAF